jgi:hypothetical protein
MSTTEPDDVRARAAVIVAAGEDAGATLERRVAAAAHEARPRLGLEGSVRAGVRDPADPLAATMGERGALEPVDAVIELTGGPAAAPSDLVPEVAALVADLASTIDASRSAVIVGHAHRFLSGEGELFVALAGYRDPAISMDELSRWWLEQHGPLALRIVEPLPRAYEQLHADHEASRAASAAGGLPERGYDMYDTIAVDSMDDLLAATMNPEVAAALFEDELGHVDHARLRGAVQRTLT